MTPYTPNAWVNDGPPALSAAHLNKICQELALQGTETGVSHSLPTWVNDGPPALTDGTPLNEMERVTEAVASVVSLSYTPTVWSSGWTPARNATRFNRLEQQVAANRSKLDAPINARRGISTFRYGSTPLPVGANRYDLLVCGWSEASVFGALAVPPISLTYMTQVGLVDFAVMNWHGGVPLAFARANNLVLQKTSGGDLLNVGYNRPVGDLGSPVYQAEWIRNVSARIDATGVEGCLIDDTWYFYSAFTSGGVSVKYPTQALWMAAVVSFATAISAAMRPRYYIGYNATGYMSPATTAVFAGDTDLALWTALAPYADGIQCEFWESHTSIPGYIRHAGTAWTDYWLEWLRLPAFCASVGMDMFATAQVGTNGTLRDYVHASLLLETGPGGMFTWNLGPTNVDADAWNTTYDRVRALGNPIGVKVQNGNRWQRQFQNGLVWVDPVAGTASIP